MKWEEHAKEKKTMILEVLKKSDIDLSEPEITRKLDFNRHTTHKYVQQLLKEKKIKVSRMVGRAAFYRIKK